MYLIDIHSGELLRRREEYDKKYPYSYADEIANDHKARKYDKIMKTLEEIVQIVQREKQ
jgi:hypothetical protein